MPDTDKALTWDLFCRVIDNHGDLGVCWRLACRLAALGQSVRLWVDDASALAWMAPDGAPGMTVQPWREPAADENPGEVVIEAFGCNPPPGFVARMARRVRPPVWINLEYLSAEAYVERCHALPSPQASGAGLMKWFFYPGFTQATGGLLHEDGLTDARAAHDANAWLGTIGVERVPGARLVSLFCYPQAALRGWLERWQDDGTGGSLMEAPRTQLLVTPGAASEQVSDWLGERVEPGRVLRRGALQVHGLPWLTQAGYDRLLWSCDLNHVRGEDSLVRALWAARPFLWQLYPQDEAVRLDKLEAFLDLYLQDAPPGPAAALRHRFRQWNRDGATAPGEDLDAEAWAALAARRTCAFERQQQHLGDLAVRLKRFVDSKR